MLALCLYVWAIVNFAYMATLFVIESDRELDTDRIKRIAILAVFWPVSLSLATLYALIKR